jgi:2-keto-4-pentenoate hydratase/2-oxohepta-3-ene-1,7-dioic acid hydratase in catechol pathway
MKRIAFSSPEAPPPPSKIVAVGRNYREHAKELGNEVPDEEPILFLKAPTALVVGGGDIVLPPESARVD